VSAFLSSIPSGWVGLDSGTGNGKYLPLPLDRPGESWTIGLDRSANLLDFAKSAGSKAREVVLGDAIECCWRTGVFDYAISIATIHHFSTTERRKLAVQSLLRCLSPKHGRALIYVWATQQDELSKRAIPSQPSNSSAERESQFNKEGVRAATGKDVFVPWTLTCGAPTRDLQAVGNSQKLESTSGPKKSSPLIPPEINASFNRYYHMFDKGELRRLVKEAARDLGIEERATLGDSRGSSESAIEATFLEFVCDDWERSNFYVEVRLWTI